MSFQTFSLKFYVKFCIILEDKGECFMDKIFVSHGDIILDKIYDGNLNLIKQDGGGCNWNDLYNLSLMGKKCYAFGTCRK